MRSRLATVRHCEDVRAGVAVHQARIGSEVTPLKLILRQLLQAGVAGQQSVGQAEQLAYLGVEHAYPVIRIQQQNALADAGEGGLQQLGVFQQFGVGPAQRIFALFAFRNVGVRTNHAHRLALCVALHNRAAGLNPFPRAVFAAHAEIHPVLG